MHHTSNTNINKNVLTAIHYLLLFSNYFRYTELLFSLLSVLIHDMKLIKLLKRKLLDMKVVRAGRFFVKGVDYYVN